MHSILLTKRVRQAAGFLWLWLVVPAALLGQAGEIKGTVTDGADRTPIPAATVRLVEVRRVDVSHEDGGFRFRDLPAGDYSVVVQRVGYRPRTLSVQVRPGQTSDMSVELQATALQLTPTIVTGSVDERSSRELMSATSVVSGVALDQQSAQTVAGVLINQPGVAVTSLGPSTGRPVIRGLGGDRILMLEDGQRPGDLSALSGDHAVAIEPATARQIEVVRGPNSLLYGSSALGGVVNVVREEIPVSRPDRRHGAVLLEGSSVSRGLTVGGYASDALGPFAVRGEATLRRSHDIDTPIGRLISTDGTTGTGALAFSVVRDVGHAGLSYRVYDNNYGVPGGFVGGHEEGVRIDMQRHTVRGEAERTSSIGPFTSLRTTAVLTRYRHEELERSGSIGTLFKQWQGSAEVVARHGDLGPWTAGAMGVRAQYRDVLTGGTLRSPSTLDYSLAGFLVEEIGRGPLRWQGGLRYDVAHYTPEGNSSIFVGGVRVPAIPRTFGSASGSLGVLYDLRETWHLGANISRAFRTPDFSELYTNGPHLAANSFDVGDPRLSEEIGLGAEVFVRYDHARVRTEMTFFRNQLDNYVFPSSRGRAELGTQGNRPRFQYTNEDAVFSGAELQLQVSLTPRLALDATTSSVRARFTSMRALIPIITATDTTFVDPSEYPPFIPPLQGTVSLRYDRPATYGGFTMRWADRQERVGDFETATAGYVLLGANVGWRILAGSRLHTVTLRVDNLLDRTYRDHLSRIKDVFPEPGRNVNVLYRLTF